MNEAFRWRWCVIAALVLLIPLVTDAVEVHPSLENKITQALKTKHAVDFVNVPLSEVLKQLAAAAKVPYFLNQNQLADEGVEPSVPVTLKRDAQEIAITLQEVLHPLLLDYEARPEWLYVTSSAVMDEVLDTRFYDVSKLVSLVEPRLILYRSPLIDQKPWQHNGGFGGGSFSQFGGGDDNPNSKAKIAHRHRIKEIDSAYPAETCLMAFIQENTSGQWEAVDGVGGTMTPGKGRLIVRQTQRVHREAIVALTNLEMMLVDPQHPQSLHLRDSEEDRKIQTEYDRLLDAPTNSAPGVMPLKQFLEENFNANGLTIYVDEAALKDEGLVWDELKITIAEGISRRALLTESFHANSLTVVFDYNRFIITTTQGCDIITTLIYDVSQIPECSDREWLAKVLFESTSGQWEDVDGVGGTLDLIGTDDLQIAGLLIVRQSEQVHEEIPEILAKLRRPLEVPSKVIEPARSRSIYALPDLNAATDLQMTLPALIAAPGVAWPPGCIVRVGSSLIVTQSEAVHRRIERLIEAMDTARKAADRPDIKADSEPKKPDTAPAEKK